MKNLFRRVSVLCSVLLLAALLYAIPCISVNADTSWIKSANIYEIFVRSFNDTNGDGVGDLNGITAKLDELKALGVKTIWLTPIFASPSDHGYDATDYKAVKPEYGTVNDLKALVNKAHSLGIKVILDLAINHCSNQNKLFTDKKDWFVWSTKDEGWPGPWDNTDAFCAGATWKKDNMGRGYFYAAFDACMPDFNYNDPATREQIITYFVDVMNFWIIKTGVDGFRCDAVRYFKESGRNYQNWTQQRDQDETHQIWQEFRTKLTQLNPDAILVAEAPTETDDQLLSYYGKGNEFNSCFHFMFQGLLTNYVIYGARDINFFNKLYGIQGRLPSNGSTCVTDTVFLSNHDSFAGARAATQVGGDVNKEKAAASLYLLMSGAPVIYYGEEIGMPNDPTKQGDDQLRGKVNWNEYDKQKADPNSVLTHYRKLINLRNSYDALRMGNTFFAHAGYKYQSAKPQPGDCVWDSSQYVGGSPVTAMIRVSGNQKILVVHNMASDKAANGGWTYVYVDLTTRCGVDISAGTKIIPLKTYPSQDEPFLPLTEDTKPSYGLGWFGPLQTKVFYIGNDLPANYKTYDNVLGN